MSNNHDYYDYNDDHGKKSNMILYIIIGVISAIIIVGSGIFLYQKYNISSLNKKAENLVEIEEYDEAIKLYNELYSTTGDVEYKTKKNQLELKSEVKSIIESAKEQESKGEFVKAISFYMQIPREDSKNYKLAEGQIETLKSDVLRKANALIDSGNKSSASSYLYDYVSLIPDDKKAVELLKNVSGKSESEVKQVIISGNTKSNDSSSSSSALNAAHASARGISGTYQYITSSEANVRSSPSKSASVVTTLHRGSQVYVSDTYVESASRIWCRIDSGWISFNTMNNSIK
ncbi:SH3 domain-containing protein [Peptostreptococcus faecalis]|uniref:SH3 domain-containing protein n=1 Tax=Peptostreptococcus faecalis TaxID=2045015 RepID=UPI000C7A17CE|nr:SH3 domain-containing protein [Peptostreptococcus faecalis]